MKWELEDYLNVIEIVLIGVFIAYGTGSTCLGIAAALYVHATKPCQII